METEKARQELIDAIVHVRKCDQLYTKGGDRTDTHTDLIDNVHRYGQRVIHECKRQRAMPIKNTHEWVDETTNVPATEQCLRRGCRFLTQPEILPYINNLRQIPRIVNVVTLAYVRPRLGSQTKLPLNLTRIASMCTGSYFAPKKFAAVQLAYSNPRARVLVFHTGRLVGTGTSGVASAKTAIMLGIRQLADEAGVFLSVTGFNVINSVGASNLHTHIACDAFANAHSSEVHYDRSSFVGLAWRPPNVPICVELYSTGRANLPGAKREHILISEFAKLLPELMSYKQENFPNGDDEDLDSDSESCSSDHQPESTKVTTNAPVSEYTEDFWIKLKEFDVDVEQLRGQESV